MTAPFLSLVPPSCLTLFPVFPSFSLSTSQPAGGRGLLHLTQNTDRTNNQVGFPAAPIQSFCISLCSITQTLPINRKYRSPQMKSGDEGVVQVAGTQRDCHLCLSAALPCKRKHWIKGSYDEREGGGEELEQLFLSLFGNTSKYLFH